MISSYHIKEATRKLKNDHALSLMKKLDLVPVVFANGEDDDTPGLLAALNNERFQYQDKIYDVNESVLFDHCIFSLSRDLVIHTSTHGCFSFVRTLSAYNNVIAPSGNRSTNFYRCFCVPLPVCRM